jgi:two-component system, chemotaxis family, CheB/CheR fusion protein
LQSTNEELETSKEELQSTNEELVTVNAELQKKVDELSMANNDMKNLLDSVDIPTIFLDTDLRIKRFTTHATKVINLIHTDIGRPIEDIVTKIEGATISADAKAVLEDLVAREKEVMAKDGSSYSMRILPYRTIENVIDGVVMTFQDLSERKWAEEGRKRLLTAVEQERDKLRTLVDSIADEIWFCDAEGNLALAKKAALGRLGIERIEEIVQPMLEWLPKLQIFTPDGRPCAEEAAPLLRSLRGDAQKEVAALVRHPQTGERLHRHVSATPIRENSGNIIGAVAVVHDITEGKRAAQSPIESEQQYRILFEMANDSIVLIDVETKRIVAFNRNAHEHLGYSREEFAKRTIADFEAAKSPDGLEKHIAKIIEQGSDVFETRQKTKDGEIRSVQVKAKAISIGEQKLILSTWDYITPIDTSGDP